MDEVPKVRTPGTDERAADECVVGQALVPVDPAVDDPLRCVSCAPGRNESEVRRPADSEDGGRGDERLSDGPTDGRALTRLGDGDHMDGVANEILLTFSLEQRSAPVRQRRWPFR
jgi:hypothetical protein